MTTSTTNNAIVLSMPGTIPIHTSFEELQQFNNGAIVVGDIAYKVEPDLALKPIEYVIHRGETERYTYVFKHAKPETFKINNTEYKYIRQDPKTSAFLYILIRADIVDRQSVAMSTKVEKAKQEINIV